MAVEQNFLPVIRQERGWAGHFICADRCQFRRNTLLTCGDMRIVVSTVGMWMEVDRKLQGLAPGRFYETMAFHAEFDGLYWDADTSRKVFFESPWCVPVCDADNIANDQHEAVVDEISRRMELGEFTERQEVSIVNE